MGHRDKCNIRLVPDVVSSDEAGLIDPPEPEESEESLVAEAIGGDKVAFTRLYDTYYDRVYRHILYRVPNTHDAEDLTQVVFLQAWRAIDKYQLKGSPFIAWLLTIAHNSVMTFYRRSRPTSPLDYDIREDSRESDPEQSAETGFDRQRLREAMRHLRPEHQQVVTMRFLENLAHRDIAMALGKTEGAVRVLQHRALAQLRRVLEGER